MKKMAIVYASIHHKNTEKLLKGAIEGLNIDLIDATKNIEADLSNYEIVGFASGIYAFKLHKSIYNFIEKNEIPKEIVLIYTSGTGGLSYAKRFKKYLSDRNITIKSVFECKALDTFFVLKLVGGINKDRPNREDIDACRKFLKNEVKSIESI
ncbi:MAG: flavodoxin [Tissierellia bacterium]|nr:flavodoxin [Tissierellia bacterium]